MGKYPMLQLTLLYLTLSPCNTKMPLASSALSHPLGSEDNTKVFPEPSLPPSEQTHFSQLLLFSATGLQKHHATVVSVMSVSFKQSQFTLTPNLCESVQSGNFRTRFFLLCGITFDL